MALILGGTLVVTLVSAGSIALLARSVRVAAQALLLGWLTAACTALPAIRPGESALNTAERLPRSPWPLPQICNPPSPQIAARFEERTGQPVTLVFGSTGQLAQQIENGAPFDLFAAANIAYVEQLRDKGLVFADSVALYAEGRIVLAVNRQAGVAGYRGWLISSTLRSSVSPSPTRTTRPTAGGKRGAGERRPVGCGRAQARLR